MTATVTANTTLMNNATKQLQTPVKIQLPPLSSILLSPAESSLRHSLISSTPNTTLNTSFAKHNIFNPIPSGPNSNPFLLPSTDFKRTHSLPTLDSFTASPTMKKSLSLPIPIFSCNQNNYPTQIPKVYPNTILSAVSLLDSHRHHPHNISSNSINVSMVSEINDSFVHSTPFKKPEPVVITESTDETKRSKKRKSLDDDGKGFAFISHSQETFLLNEPDIDNARLARRKRRRTSALELSILNEEFKIGPTPNKQRRLLIAEKVDMTEKAVQIWFQNKRQAIRKQFKKQSISVNENLNSEISNESLDDDSDKENVNPDITANTSLLPPKGKFSTSPSTKQPLADVTNSMSNHTFKFKSTNFSLVHHTSTAKRQKPTMKLKMKIDKE